MARYQICYSKPVTLSTRFKQLASIETPVICGAMYPCSNPELVAAVSEAGGLGIIQPISLTYVHGYDLKGGIGCIRQLTSKPVGFNVIVEKNSRVYEDRMKTWVDIALAEGIRFFVTALGNPGWVIEKVKPFKGVVFHDVTSRKWADKVIPLGVDGLICVNNRAGGHAGTQGPKELYDELKDLGIPLICAGGVGDEHQFIHMMQIGYDGVQMGTRFIATKECNSHEDYKEAIIRAKESDIVKTERVTGVPLSVIRTPYVDRVGVEVGPISKWLFKHRKTRHWIRMFYNIRALIAMKKSSQKGLSTKDYYQAGKSVAGIESVETVASIMKRLRAIYATAGAIYDK